MDDLKHALFVAFHYPPEASSSGVLRTLKYTRYLADYGWRVTIVAPREDAYEITDAKLTEQIPSTARVIRTRFLNTKRHLSIRGIYPALFAVPDTWVGWLPWAVAAGRRLMADDPVDAIYSTSPHATAHVIAERLAAGSARPWIADFRDPWIEEPPEPGTPNGPVFRAANRWLEKRVATRCEAIVTSTLHLRDQFRRRYPYLPEDKTRAILNGYDEADFANLEARVSIRGGKLRIVHTGSVNAEFRDPRPLFQALARMIQGGNLTASECEIRFIGGGPFGESPEVRAAVDAAGLSRSVSFVRRVPYEESLRELGEADVLLLLQASDDTVGLVPAKLYENLRAQKPTLALVRTGAVSEVLAQTRGGWSVDPAQPKALDDALSEIARAWRGGSLAEYRADLAVLKRFDRRALTAELSSVFEDACKRGAR